MTIKSYSRPDSLAEAYASLTSSAGNAVIAGLTSVKMGMGTIETAVDLSGLGLDYIREDGGLLRIGAMASLRKVELSEACGRACSGILREAVGHIGGVQLRSHATLGGAVMSLWSSSDTLAALLALDAGLLFHRAGAMGIEAFLDAPLRGDILTEISIPDLSLRCAREALRISCQDIPILTVAVAARGGQARIAVGARPRRAALARAAMRAFAQGATPAACGAAAALELEFGGDARGSAGYRRELCAVLVERCLAEVAR